jgi:hypothetical protein
MRRKLDVESHVNLFKHFVGGNVERIETLIWYSREANLHGTSVRTVDGRSVAHLENRLGRQDVGFK